MSFPSRHPVGALALLWAALAIAIPPVFEWTLIALGLDRLLRVVKTLIKRAFAEEEK